jgi:hypothetical protein
MQSIWGSGAKELVHNTGEYNARPSFYTLNILPISVGLNYTIMTKLKNTSLPNHSFQSG